MAKISVSSSNRMFFMFILPVFATLTYPVASQFADSSCGLSNEGSWNTISDSCFSSIPGVKSYFLEIMANISSGISLPSVGNFDFRPEMNDMFCRRPGEAAKAVHCLQGHALECIPDSGLKDTILRLGPDQGRWENIMALLCENRHILEAQMNCQDSVSSQMFGNCYQRRLENALRGLTPENRNSFNYEAYICSLPTMVNECMILHHGNCSDDYVRINTEVVENLLRCSAVVQASATILLLTVALFLSFFNKYF